MKYKRIRPRIAMNSEYITIHETANTTRGANAAAHARLLSSGNQSRQASWHFTVDDKEIYQHLPISEIGWHAGDGGNGTGNRKSIGIEICVNTDGNYEKAKAIALELVKFLMQKHGIPSRNVVPHKKWSGKNCPQRLLSGWTGFISKLGVAKPTIINPYPGHLIRKGSRGEVVKKIQSQLGGLVVDGIFGKKIEATVRGFQRKKGLGVDGVVGPKTWAKLF
nr:N-acetylmuramoyl-L-alanine amidase [Risungbinella massiliensis]